MQESNIISPDKLKDVLITRTAIKTLQSERTVEKVISFQFQDAREMVKVYQEIEISGFGKLIMSQAKIRRKLVRLNRILMSLDKLLAKDGLSEDKIQEYKDKIGNVQVSIDYLKTKQIVNEN